MRFLLSLLIFMGSWSVLTAQEAKKMQDQEAIKDMCGCYEVRFNFAETFDYVEDSTYVGSPDKLSGGLEWVELVEDKDDKIVMQHLLIVGPEDNQMIVKHWRQDWIYQNTELYDFYADLKWEYTNLPYKQVEGQWTQKVYQVDDSPRYEGTGSWVHVDGRSYWESYADAPLPRREFSIRDDYNVLYRKNRHEITATGWNHEQDNVKILRKNGTDTPIAAEKGMNTYTKVADEKCQAAMDYWAINHEMWKKVRTKWDQVFARDINLELHKKVDDKLLFQHMFALDSTATQAQIDEIIDAFVKESAVAAE